MAGGHRTQTKGQRQQAILAELRASPAIRISELAAVHQVSTETIRRDLDELTEGGLINRTYGGATGTPLSAEPLLDERYRSNTEERMAIAKGVVPLIRDGDSLMIDAGATTIFVARRLAAHCNDLSVVTTSFGVASALAANPSIRIRICPGTYDPSDGGVTGPDTIDYLRQFRVAHAILGASGLDGDGPSDANAGSVWIKRAMIAQADQAIFVLHHDKLGLVGFERICPLAQVDRLVTDRPPPDDLADVLKQTGVTLHVPERS